jgi:hypothetical protein
VALCSSVAYSMSALSYQQNISLFGIEQCKHDWSTSNARTGGAVGLGSLAAAGRISAGPTCPSYLDVGLLSMTIHCSDCTMQMYTDVYDGFNGVECGCIISNSIDL